MDQMQPQETPEAPQPDQEPAAPPAGQEQPQPGQQGAQGPQAKQVFRQFILAAMKIIYGEQSGMQLVQLMKSQADDPATAVAHAAMVVIGKMQESAKGINPQTVITAAPAVMCLLFDVARAAKLFTADKDTLTQALQVFAQMSGGQAQPQGQEQAPPQDQPPGQDQPQGPPGLIAGAMQQQPEK